MKDLDKLKYWYENLSPESLEQIDTFYTEQSFFKDPFNEFYSRDKIKGIFKDMFNKLESPSFVFIDLIDSNEASFITWDFKFLVKGKEFVIHGSTHLKWESGRIYYHRDYWDVGEEVLLKIPLLRRLYGSFRKKLAH